MTKLTLALAKSELRQLDMTLTKKDGEYRVNFKGGEEGTAYYTDDLEDARLTGIKMAAAVAEGWLRPRGDTAVQGGVLRTIMSEQWLAALSTELSTEHAHGLRELPLDSVVGQACARTVRLIDQLQSDGWESDLWSAMLRNAVEQMAIWLFG